jgi:hypothetical protein
MIVRRSGAWTIIDWESAVFAGGFSAFAASAIAARRTARRGAAQRDGVASFARRGFVTAVARKAGPIIETTSARIGFAGPSA